MGLFHASVALEEEFALPNYAFELLQESLEWFRLNLTAPTLPSDSGRCVFWFRTDADQLLKLVWPLVDVFNQAGLYVHQRTTSSPGQIVYSDEFQVAAIPGRR
jgi:hypothetical protein